MSLPKTFPLKVAGNKTIDVPSVGFGTWASGDTSWAKDATLNALKAGYRHIDGAWTYGVDEAVGAAIKESGVPREEIFVTSKARHHFLSPEHVELCLDQVLRNMGLEYVDLWLAHWPSSWKPISREALEKAWAGPTASSTDIGYQTHGNGKPVIDWKNTSTPIAKKAGQEGSFVATWQAMQDLVRKGKARAVGVSNFSQADLEALLPYSKEIPLSCNQIEVQPWMPQNELIEFHNKHGILTTAWGPFTTRSINGKTLINDDTIKRIAKDNGMDVGQVLQSWAVQRGTIPLGKSSTPSRIASNLAVKRLPDADFEAINQFAMPHDQGRTINPSKAWGTEFF